MNGGLIFTTPINPYLYGTTTTNAQWNTDSSTIAYRGYVSNPDRMVATVMKTGTALDDVSKYLNMDEVCRRMQNKISQQMGVYDQYREFAGETHKPECSEVKFPELFMLDKRVEDMRVKL